MKQLIIEGTSRKYFLAAPALFTRKEEARDGATIETGGCLDQRRQGRGDKDGVDVAGYLNGSNIEFLYDYVANTQAGLPANTDKEMIVVVAGNGIAKSAKTEFILKNQDLNSATCSPGLETNI